MSTVHTLMDVEKLCAMQVMIVYTYICIYGSIESALPEAASSACFAKDPTTTQHTHTQKLCKYMVYYTHTHQSTL